MYRSWNGYEIQIRRNIQGNCNIDINLRYRRLAIVSRVRVDLPVLFHGMAPEKDGADDRDVGDTDKDICNFDTYVHVD